MTTRAPAVHITLPRGDFGAAWLHTVPAVEPPGMRAVALTLARYHLIGGAAARPAPVYGSARPELRRALTGLAAERAIAWDPEHGRHLLTEHGARLHGADPWQR